MSRQRHGSKPLNPELMEALNAMDDVANDMPDGAWWAMLEEVVTNFNKRTSNGYDPNDAVHQWLRESPRFKGGE